MVVPELQSKVALVTGGANGIGAATVRALHAQGARVFFCDLDATAGTKLARLLGERVTFAKVDLRRERDIGRWSAAACRAAGRIDILINNAAHDPRIDLEQTSAAAWDRLFATNLRAYFLTCREAVRHLRRGSAIVNLASIGKTNFRDYVLPSYGAALAPDGGLFGSQMPGAANTPRPMTFSSAFNRSEGPGIPIAPIDDAGRANPYPLMRLTAKNAAGTVMAKTDVVLPVSGEMNCRACHSSGSGPAAMPAAGWENDPHPSRDCRLNALRLHDEK